MSTQTKVDIDTSTLGPLVGILKALPAAATFQIRIGDAAFAGPAVLTYDNAGAVLQFEQPKSAPKATKYTGAGG